MRSRILHFCMLLAPAGPVSAGSELAPFRSVFDVISAPNIYTTTWATLLEQLDPWCAESHRSETELIVHGNVECKPEVHAMALTVSSDSEGRVSMIEASFKGAATCAYMKRKLLETFGRPKISKGACLREWRIPTNRGRPYFSIGEEQGP